MACWYYFLDMYLIYLGPVILYSSSGFTIETGCSPMAAWWQLFSFLSFLRSHQLMLLMMFNHSALSNSSQPHGLQHVRLPCPSLSLGVGSNSCPLSQWCHPIISFSVVPFFSALSLSQNQCLFQSLHQMAKEIISPWMRQAELKMKKGNRLERTI